MIKAGPAIDDFMLDGQVTRVFHCTTQRGLLIAASLLTQTATAMPQVTETIYILI